MKEKRRNIQGEMPADYEGKWCRILKYNTRNSKGPNDLQIFSIGRATREKNTDRERLDLKNRRLRKKVVTVS